MLPNAQLKFGDIHYILQEEFDADLTEPLPQGWTEILEQLHRPETGQRQARDRPETGQRQARDRPETGQSVSSGISAGEDGSARIVRRNLDAATYLTRSRAIQCSLF
jgi:hypothetical protein